MKVTPTVEIDVLEDKLILTVRNGRSVGTFTTDSILVVNALIDRLKSVKSKLIEQHEVKELGKILGS